VVCRTLKCVRLQADLSSPKLQGHYFTDQEARTVSEGSECVRQLFPLYEGGGSSPVVNEVLQFSGQAGPHVEDSRSMTSCLFVCLDASLLISKKMVDVFIEGGYVMRRKCFSQAQTKKTSGLLAE
jgi:hypothetical protein